MWGNDLLNIITCGNPIICQLRNRSVFKISGKDSALFLQGLVSQDMRKILPVGNKYRNEIIGGGPPDYIQTIPFTPPKLHPICGIYCLFLSNKGKILTDATIYNIDPLQINESPMFLLDCSTDASQSIIDLILGRKLMADVSIHDLSNEVDCFQLFSFHNNNASFNFEKVDNAKNRTGIYDPNWYIDWVKSLSVETTLRNDKSTKYSNGYICRDPRYWRLGYRIFAYKSFDNLLKCQILANSAKSAGFIENLVSNNLPSMTIDPTLKKRDILKIFLNNPKFNYELYTWIRTLYGVPEGSDVIRFNKYFPPHLNFDFLNTVCTSKGCYVGQEVVHKLWNSQYISKRLVTCISYSDGREYQLQEPMSTNDICHLLDNMISLIIFDNGMNSNLLCDRHESQMFIVGRKKLEDTRYILIGSVISIKLNVAICLLHPLGKWNLNNKQEYIKEIKKFRSWELYLTPKSVDEWNANPLAKDIRREWRVIIIPTIYVFDF